MLGSHSNIGSMAHHNFKAILMFYFYVFNLMMYIMLIG